MAIYQINLQPGPFQAIKNKEKTIEMRLNDERRKPIQIGDYILFINTGACAYGDF